MNWQDDDDFLAALADFSKILSVFEPYRHDFVIVGGVAAFLYRIVGSAPDDLDAPLLTYDLDLLVPPERELRDAPPFKELLHESGLIIVPVSLNNPAKTLIACKERQSSATALPRIYAEFLTDAKSRTPGVVKYSGGIGVSELRYMRVLGLEPLITCDLRDQAREALAGLGRVRLPHPMNFIVQKVLMERSQTPERSEREAKDAAYIVEVVRTYYRQLDFLTDRWRAMKREQQLPKKWFFRFEEQLRARFGTPDAVGILDAEFALATIPAAPENSAEALARVMATFLDRLLGS